MLSDRSYMRGETGRNSPGFLAWFLGGLAAIFVFQRISEVFFRSEALLDYGALSSHGLRNGEVWTLLSYALLHGGLTHLLLNGLGLFFAGRYLQDTLGAARLAWLTVAGTLGGAAAWLAVFFGRPGTVIGASGIVMAYLTVFACLQPRRPMTVFLFFILPITIQPVWFISILGGIEVFGLLTKELPASHTLYGVYGVAHSAHLGGMAAGWLFYRMVLKPRRLRSGATIEPPAWLRKRSARPASVYTVNVAQPSTPSEPAATARRAAAAPAPGLASHGALSAEVDRILDKINLHGFDSLTDAEKRVLDEARHHIGHR
jgi:membrane associated rhomboid family serine protease